MKRICRQHGISRWPSRKINKVNRSLTKLKCVIESVQGADAAFSLTSLAPPTIPVAVGSLSWPPDVSGACQQYQPITKPAERLDEGMEHPSSKPRVDGQTSGRPANERNPDQSGFSPKIRSGSRDMSSGASTSHGSCHGSPGTESNPPKGHFTPNFHEKAGNSLDLMVQQNGVPHLPTGFSPPDAYVGRHPWEPFRGMLVEDAGSSKDLKNLCPLASEAHGDEVIPERSWTSPAGPNPASRLSSVGAAGKDMRPRLAARQDMKSVTIKATFREDIIRFRFSLSSNIVELKEEVAKRLRLEVGTFEIKYLDDDHEWVLVACNSDLQEFLDLSRSSGSHVIRLLVHDISGNLGSSCESSGDL